MESKNNKIITDELQIILNNGFTKFNDTILKQLLQVFNNPSSVKRDYEFLMNHCCNNPSIVFDVINYSFPYINKNNNIRTLIDGLRIGFKNNGEISYYLNTYYTDLLKLLEKDDILDALKLILKYILVQLHRYHNIFKQECKDYDLERLLIEEYKHRNKLN